MSGSTKAQHAMPFVRIELAVLAVEADVLKVLLGRRAEAPYAGSWALPGGVLRIDLDADLDAACQRVAMERLGIPLPGAQQQTAVGARGRDPRSPWALSIIYRCTTRVDQVDAVPGKRMTELKWVDAAEAAADKRLAFDHGSIIGQAVSGLRSEIHELRFPAGLVGQPFTLGELQACAEAVLGSTLDKSSFRRRIDAVRCVEPVQGQMKKGPYRPAQLFRLTLV